jgi:RHS repeat-associated protein
VWRESYTYDGNGNRASKTTPWGTINYSYDAENRLIQKGDVVYTYDKDGNLLSEKGLRREAAYRYNGQNRMAYSEVLSHVEQSRIRTGYTYDAFGRRTEIQDEGGQAVRTLYDGTGFETVREGVTFTDGRFTTRYSEGIQGQANTGTGGSRYRWVGDEDSTEARTRSAEEAGYRTVSARYTGTGVTLYGKGEAVAVSRSAGAGTRGGSAYLGKDLLGSVRSTTDDNGNLEDRYEYDAFGKPYKGDLTTGMNLGYTGKPYDPATGLYNYGYRDYKPEAARFTTVDPIRDGSNWFAYVNNDPVNWVDPWGLENEVFYNSSTFFGGSESGLHQTKITTYAVVNTNKRTVEVWSVSTDSIYQSGDVKSDTIASVRVGGIAYDSKNLSRNNLKPSVIQEGKTQLGSATLSLPPGYGSADTTVVTVTNYTYNAGYGIWEIGSQAVRVSLKPENNCGK